MVILLTSMVLNIPQDLIEISKQINISTSVLMFLSLMGVFFAYLLALFYRARYRIPVNKIGLNSRFKRYSYFEVMLNQLEGCLTCI